MVRNKDSISSIFWLLFIDEDNSEMKIVISFFIVFGTDILIVVYVCFIKFHLNN